MREQARTKDEVERNRGAAKTGKVKLTNSLVRKVGANRKFFKISQQKFYFFHCNNVDK